MSREDKYVVPFIRQAGREAGENIKILCAPWSPPAFMKNNKSMNDGGRLLRKYYGAWARYMVKYVKGMLERGVDIRIMSVQNEPEAKQTMGPPVNMIPQRKPCWRWIIFMKN